MNIKTSDLIGPALDWAVAEAWNLDQTDENLRVAKSEEDRYHSWCPSTIWSQGGQIIEQEKIGICFNAGEWIGSIPATLDDPNNWDWKFNRTGPTPLIAAMRCYVASKLGDDVDIPEELK